MRCSRGVLIALPVLLLALVTPSTAGAQAGYDQCVGTSPIALPCVLGQKVTEAVAAECRRAGIAEAQCTLPLAKSVTTAARDAYVKSWVHRAAQRQYDLQNGLSLLDVTWIGTHNSFNAPANGATVSHWDSNQQLTLSQQLDLDVRSLELDLHNIRGVVTVCHGQPPSNLDVGCTTEPPLTQVLPELRRWLDAHPSQVLLLYLEDALDNADAYTAAVAQIQAAFKRPDGSSLLYLPDPSRKTAKGCTNLPLGLSRNEVRAGGSQIVLVGNCVPGWSSLVYGWDDVHVESGSTPKYQAYPGCDAVYKPEIYASKMIRYFEDSTLVSVVIDPATPAVNPDRLTPEKVKAMVACGVNLFGFDQLLPEDGRLEATIWSWAKDQPSARDGGCTVQRADGRWTRRKCGGKLRAACLGSTGWRLSRRSVTHKGAPKACGRSASFALPRTATANAQLRAAAGASRVVWLGR